MGSGPYRVIDVDPGRSITYESVKDYWGPNLPVNRGHYNFDRIRYDYYRDQTVALEAFKSNEFDFRQESRAECLGNPAMTSRPSAMASSSRKRFPTPSPCRCRLLLLTFARISFRIGGFARHCPTPSISSGSNKNLFHGQYKRSKSFFPNTDLASSGLPTKAELHYLEPLRGQIPDEVFTKPYAPPRTDGSGNVRANLRKAQRLLREAGWRGCAMESWRTRTPAW